MAASATFSYVTSPPHPYPVQKVTLQHVDAYVVHMRGISDYNYRLAKQVNLRYYQKPAGQGNTLQCKCMYGGGSEAQERFSGWASEGDAWRALNDQIEAFRGGFPQEAAASSFQALVDQLDAVADPANPQMQILLGQAKRLLKCPRASLVHYLNLVRNAETSGHPQLGAWYLETGLACREAGDLEGALHFCSKALEASMGRFGASSLHVAQARSAMSKVYFNLARYKESIREAEVARPLLKDSGNLEEVISLELTMADTLYNLARYNEVVPILEEVVNNTTGGLVQINAIITTAKTYFALGKIADAKAQCKKASDLLDLQEPSVETAAHFVMLASMYEQQEEFEQVAASLTKSISMYQKFPQNSPQEFITELEGKVGRILLRIRHSEEALPYLERHLSKKKVSVGPLSQKNSKDGQELLYAHYYLGAAYSQCEKFHNALEHFEACMVLLSDNCRGENPSFAMTVYNNAASMYYHLDRLDRAIECQRAAVDVLKRNKLGETSAAKRIEELLEQYLEEANSSQ